MSDSNDIPVQLGYKKGWDTSNLPKGGVAARAAMFGQFMDGQKKPQHALENTGKTNPSVKLSRAALKQVQSMEAPLSPRTTTNANPELQRKRKEKLNKAATKIQAQVRLRQAKRYLKIRENEFSERRKRNEKRHAATTIQRVARGNMARNRALRELERRIAQEEARLRKQQVKEKERMENERKELSATTIQCMVRSHNARKVFNRRKADADTRTQQEKEDQAATKIQALARAAMARDRVKIIVERLIEELMRKETEEARQKEEAALAEQRRMEEEREQRELEERKRAEAERLRKLQEGFIPFEGPLWPQVGVIPEWWMTQIPHKTYRMDAFDEAMEELWVLNMVGRGLVQIMDEIKEEDDVEEEEVIYEEEFIEEEVIDEEEEDTEEVVIVEQEESSPATKGDNASNHVEAGGSLSEEGKQGAVEGSDVANELDGEEEELVVEEEPVDEQDTLTHKETTEDALLAENNDTSQDQALDVESLVQKTLQEIEEKTDDPSKGGAGVGSDADEQIPKPRNKEPPKKSISIDSVDTVEIAEA